MTWQRIGLSGSILPASARLLRAASLRAPATTAYLSFLCLRTTSDCSRPCAAMDAASSAMVVSAPAVLRTLPSQATSLLSGMDVVSVITLLLLLVVFRNALRRAGRRSRAGQPRFCSFRGGSAPKKGPETAFGRKPGTKESLD